MAEKVSSTNDTFSDPFWYNVSKISFKKFVPEIKKVDETSNKFQSTIV